MNRLVTGTGRMGTSWQIRGDQLGRAINATVDPSPWSVAGFDQMILVKRAKNGAAGLAYKAGVPIVYDVVDAWQAYVGHDSTEKRCKQWLREHISFIRPSAIVASTVQMAEDCAQFSLPTIAIEHHARPEQPINPIREKVTKVGYEGSPVYLGIWREILDAECAVRGWTFHVNPPRLSDLDIVVAMRDEDGYGSRHWKSNVKLANAQGSGTPCIMNRERGYLETACGAELWADSRKELAKALDELADHKGRMERSEKLRLAAPQLANVAKRYGAWLDAL